MSGQKRTGRLDLVGNVAFHIGQNANCVKTARSQMFNLKKNKNNLQ